MSNGRRKVIKVCKDCEWCSQRINLDELWNTMAVWWWLVLEKVMNFFVHKLISCLVSTDRDLEGGIILLLWIYVLRGAIGEAKSIRPRVVEAQLEKGINGWSIILDGIQRIRNTENDIPQEKHIINQFPIGTGCYQFHRLAINRKLLGSIWTPQTVYSPIFLSSVLRRRLIYSMWSVQIIIRRMMGRTCLFILTGCVVKIKGELKDILRHFNSFSKFFPIFILFINNWL